MSVLPALKWTSQSLEERSLAYNRIRLLGSGSIFLITLFYTLLHFDQIITRLAMLLVLLDLIVLKWHQWMAARHQATLSTWVTLVEAALVTTLGQHLGGGIATSTVVIHPILILSAALIFLEQQAAYYMALICTALEVLLGVAEYRQWLPWVFRDLQAIYLYHSGLVQANQAVTLIALIVTAVLIGPAVELLSQWNQTLNQQVQQKTQYLQALLHSSHEITAFLQQEKIMNALLQHVHTLLNANVAFYLFDEQRHALSPAITRGEWDVHTVPLTPQTFAEQLLPGTVRPPAPGTSIQAPLQHRGRFFGILIAAHPNGHPFTREEEQIFATLANQAAVALNNASLYDDLEQTYTETVLALANAIEARDYYTEDHSQRIAALATEVGRRLGCTADALECLRWAAILHDIGKIGIPDHILRKPGKLTPEERQIIEKHPDIGANIIRPLRKLSRVAEVIRAHHERFDGRGYPRGLKGEEIPLEARILTAVDAYISMTDQRVYGSRRCPQEARAELRLCAGTQFDPQVVETLIQILESEEAT